MTAGRRYRTPTGGKVSAYTLALNYLPILFLVAGGLATWAVEGAAARWAVALGWVYLLPPIVGRVTLLLFGQPHARGVEQDSIEYKVWWFLAQLQVHFNRLPFLEELLRLVPGLYPAWLNLWGSRVSPFAYWGPGSRVLDRYLVRVERGAVIGAQAVLAGHLGTVDDDGTFLVDIAPVTVGEGAIIGAAAALGPGSRVEPHELLPAGRRLQPFCAWREGRRVREETEA